MVLEMKYQKVDNGGKSNQASEEQWHYAKNTLKMEKILKSR